MAQIRRRKPNGLNVVSTFSGTGGSCLGFKQAGYANVFASEFVPAARESYEANFPGTPVDGRDVRELTGDDIRKATGLEAFDVLEGSPPCASFSMSGKRDEGWGSVRKYSDTKQRVDDLFWEFARLLGEVRPRAFVAENVPGLATGVAKGYYLRIMSELRSKGYVTDVRLLDAQWLGVPQRRKRLVIVGFRERADMEAFTWPVPLPYRYTIRDALPTLAGIGRSTGFKGSRDLIDPPDEPLPTLMADGLSGASVSNAKAVEAIILHESGYRPGRTESLDDPSPTVMASGIGGNGKANVKIIHDTGRGREKVRVVTDDVLPTVTTGTGGNASHFQVVPEDEEYVPYGERDSSNDLGDYAIGQEWEKLRQGQGSDKYLNLTRADAEDASPTITAAGGPPASAGVMHPTERRKFTIAELRLLCGFPADFVLTGSYSQQWERLGRAVPPPMMEAVAREVAKALLRSRSD